MVRPPCCDKDGIKKGPWTPEEDIILVSYIQEHGPGNWRSVPTNTGLMRCSKSCRLRWTNYLRPGIRRGNFTPHEEGLIIHLQALLGNKWAAIASYLPQRTDNDIKNYWNTHLKKKLRKHQAIVNDYESSLVLSTPHHEAITQGYNNETGVAEISTIHSSLTESSLGASSVYASSTENISRLLKGWMGNSLKTEFTAHEKQLECNSGFTISSSSSTTLPYFNVNQITVDQENCPISTGELEPLQSADNSTEKSSLHTVFSEYHNTLVDINENARLDVSNPPLSLLEKWLLDETTGQVDLKELASDYYQEEL